MSEKKGVKCQVTLSLETMMYYQEATKKMYGGIELTLGDFIDACVEDTYKARREEKLESPLDYGKELQQLKAQWITQMEYLTRQIEQLKSRDSFSEHLSEIIEISELLHKIKES